MRSASLVASDERRLGCPHDDRDRETDVDDGSRKKVRYTLGLGF
jgi:hypothetical protein